MEKMTLQLLSQAFYEVSVIQGPDQGLAYHHFLGLGILVPGFQEHVFI